MVNSAGTVRETKALAKKFVRYKEGAELYSMVQTSQRSEERRVGKECRSRWSPYH